MQRNHAVVGVKKGFKGDLPLAWMLYIPFGMGRPARVLQDEFPYHITTRTAGRLLLFKIWTYVIIIQVLIEAQKRYNVLIHHFKMMHTHYHMLVTTQDKNISAFQWYVNNQIAKRINKKMNRKGHLWGERFFSTIISDEGYLAKCIRYIYMNGVRAGLCRRASEDAQFSTFDFYAGGKKVEFDVKEDEVYIASGHTSEERQIS